MPTVKIWPLTVMEMTSDIPDMEGTVYCADDTVVPAELGRRSTFLTGRGGRVAWRDTAGVYSRPL
jgi:hypothetical protein